MSQRQHCESAIPNIVPDVCNVQYVVEVDELSVSRSMVYVGRCVSCCQQVCEKAHVMDEQKPAVGKLERGARSSERCIQL